ncbi:cellulose biosynthesis protein BcsP [Caballeronia sp. BR00000012568055]|uniref:cellulose biosynthesis protein BcsP n=1 Tax=Caballeronia sp. BR00000012568055 TaxID=2918761 RepID=UPI0023F7C1FC|nr:cellulose biosynthesis protein BcsP [Caballeronia sp. BR00000012568055]
MNTSRDIEKLFDHFGGNAGDYQEIGRENEAKTARTRWPLLATLDLAQPAIPEIAQRRETQAPRVAEPVPAPTTEATPINRGKPPLFARPHRRTIPVVDTSAKRDSLSASRFGPLTTETEPEIVVSVAAVTPAPVPAPVPAAAAPKKVEPQPSILGQLFKPQHAEPAPVAKDNALNAMFDRLRGANTATQAPTTTQAEATRPRRTWGPRS